MTKYGGRVIDNVDQDTVIMNVCESMCAQVSRNAV